MFENKRDAGRSEPALTWPEAISVRQPRTEGYLAGVWVSDQGSKIPMILASVSRDNVFPILLEILGSLKRYSEVANVALDTMSPQNSVDMEQRRDEVSLNLILSHLEDKAFQDALLANGDVSFAVMVPSHILECQLDAHKQIIIYAHNPEAMLGFELILRRHRIFPDQMKRDLPSELEHLHLNTSSSVDMNRFIASLGLEVEAEEEK